MNLRKSFVNNYYEYCIDSYYICRVNKQLNTNRALTFNSIVIFVSEDTEDGSCSSSVALLSITRLRFFVELDILQQ